MKKLGFSKKQTIILLSLWLAFLLTFVTRLSWSTLMSDINEALDFTVAQSSNLVSAFYIGYAITVLPGGILSDRMGYKKAILGSLGMMAIVTALMSTIQSYEMAFAYRVLLGVVSGPLQSACLSAIGDLFTDKQKGTATGIFLTCTSFGITVINSYAPSVSSSFGWPAAFLVTAAIPLIVLVFCYFSLPKTQKKVEVESNSAEHTEKLSLKDSMLMIVKDKNILLLCIAGFFATGTTWGVTNWTNLYMTNNVGVSTVFAGTIMSIYGIAALIAKPASGLLSDFLPVKKNTMAAIFLFMFTLTLMLFASTTSPNFLYLSGPLLGVGAFMYSPIFNALGVQAANPRNRATTAGFINLFNQVGSLLAPMLLGKILDVTGDYSLSLKYLAIFPLFAAIALIFIKISPKNN